MNVLDQFLKIFICHFLRDALNEWNCYEYYDLSYSERMTMDRIIELYYMIIFMWF